MPHSPVSSGGDSSGESIVAGECNNVTQRLTKSESSSVMRAEVSKINSTEPVSNLANPSSDPVRETWGKKVEFLLAVIGFAVDLGNVWRFPTVCYMNGGGAFLVPYVIMLICGGLPLFYMELALGQYYRSGCLTLWKHICPALKGIGYAICIIDIYVGVHYNTIIGWAVYYLGASFTSDTLPWSTCNNPWNTDECRILGHKDEPTMVTVTDEYGMNYTMELNYTTRQNVTTSTPAKEYYERAVLEIQKSNGIEDIGGIKWSLAGCVFIVFIIVYFSLWKGVRSSGKAVWVTALAPYVVLFILLGRGLTLDGASDGISYYLTPKWEKLWKIRVWTDAAIQIFFSLGPGFGTLLALASYNKFNNNCYRDALLTSTVNCLTSFLSGFVIFSVLGYMAKVQDKKIDDMGIEGFGLVFIVYPEALATMWGAKFWSIIFFVMLITLGLDSTFGGLEAVITALCDEYPRVLGKHREIFVAGLLVFVFICSLPTCTYGGSYVVALINLYGPGISTLFIVFLEAIAVSWLYGVDRFSGDIRRMIGDENPTALHSYWTICWTFVSPVFIIVLFVSSIVYGEELRSGSYIFPEWTNTVGLAMIVSSLICIPAYILYLFLITPGTLLQRIQKMIKPVDHAEVIVYNQSANYGTTV